MLTALILALLCNSSLEDALRTISGLRVVEPWKVWERKGGHEIGSGLRLAEDGLRSTSQSPGSGCVR